MRDIIFVIPGEHWEGVNMATNSPSLGIAYLAGMLQKNGFSCAVVDMTVSKTTEDDVLEKIAREKPLAVGISVNLFNAKAGMRLSRRIKKKYHNDLSVIFGGAFPTSHPGKFLVEGLADCVVLGEGEYTLLEIMKGLKEKYPGGFGEIMGVAYQEEDQIIYRQRRERIRDLDLLPFPAWELFPSLSLYKTRSRKSPVAPLLTSRGCPFHCIYCSKDVFKSEFITRSPQNIIDEIDVLVKVFNVRQLDIMDDNFTQNRDRVEAILDLLIQRRYSLAINLQLGVRADSVDEKLLRKMKSAGVYKIAFGVESGDGGVLKNVKKQLDLEVVLKNARLAKETGMLVYGFFMFGLPGDTPATMQKTIDFAMKMNPHIANFVITIPFPGTFLYDLAKQKGNLLIDTADGLQSGFYSQKVFYELGDTKAEDVLRYYNVAYRSFYGRIPKIIELLFSIRSLSELRWILSTATSVLRPLVIKKAGSFGMLNH
ncbi:MAG: radical SAM protein [Smithella sp.]|jgi:radical SAM superfamily enzyme YgiQ (UPF0313 family)